MKLPEAPKRLLVIDSLNMFFRAYIVDPSMSVNGDPIGGMKGYLKILQKLLRETKPDKVIICWDGPGGSQKRKQMVKSYKEGRKPLRLNRNIRLLNDNEQMQNQIYQQTRLVEYLNQTPIIQLMLEGVEADDIISFVVNDSRHQGWQKIIVSSDKDFFQLCDDETIIYRPIQKEVLNKNNVIEKFDIHPTNFALARAIAGDKSDNLKGVDRVGLTTVAKRLPFLKEQKTYTIEDIFKYCKKQVDSIKAYNNIVEQIDVVEINYKMMQLYSPYISIQGKNKIKWTLDQFNYAFNKTQFLKMTVEDSFGTGDWTSLFTSLKNMSMKNKLEKK
jgi:DNA polymerase-1|tara:strand:+ start:248 stop:1237 length:990 start_codon:yes stop_codon:yes gene_type:complete